MSFLPILIHVFCSEMVVTFTCSEREDMLLFEQLLHVNSSEVKP